MRIFFLFAIVVVLLGGCGSSLYTRQDLADVTRLYGVIRPIYADFRTAYFHNDYPGMRRAFAREQTACKAVDIIDKRDSMDPNTNIFQVSGGLDTLCNEIESAYAAWRKKHHMKYDTSIEPAVPADLFKGSEAVMLQIPALLCHPGGIVGSLPTPPPTPNAQQVRIESGQYLPHPDCSKVPIDSPTSKPPGQ